MDELQTIEIEEVFKTAILRFLGESPPLWDKKDVEKLVATYGYKLEEKKVQQAISNLVSKKIIYLLKKDEAYFVVHEEFIKQHIPEFYVDVRISDVLNLKKKYSL